MNTGSAARARPSGSSNRSRRVAFLTVPIARIRLHGWPGERCPGRVEELAGDIGYRGLRVPVSLVLAEGVFLVENGRLRRLRRWAARRFRHLCCTRRRKHRYWRACWARRGSCRAGGGRTGPVLGCSDRATSAGCGNSTSTRWFAFFAADMVDWRKLQREAVDGRIGLFFAWRAGCARGSCASERPDRDR